MKTRPVTAIGIGIPCVSKEIQLVVPGNSEHMVKISSKSISPCRGYQLAIEVNVTTSPISICTVVVKIASQPDGSLYI